MNMESRLYRIGGHTIQVRLEKPWTFKVLTENRTGDGILGFTENYLRVCAQKELKENEIYELTIDGTETKFIPQ